MRRGLSGYRRSCLREHASGVSGKDWVGHSKGDDTRTISDVHWAATIWSEDVVSHCKVVLQSTMILLGPMRKVRTVALIGGHGPDSYDCSLHPSRSHWPASSPAQVYNGAFFILTA